MTEAIALQQNTLSTGHASVSSQAELLRFILERDNLSLDDAVSEMQKAKRNRIIDNHPYSIFRTKDGRWRSWLPDKNSKGGRKQICKKSLEKLHDVIVDYYEKQEEESKQSQLSYITVEMFYPQWKDYKRLHTPSESYMYRIQTEWDKYYEGTPIVRKQIRELTKVELDVWAHRLIRENDMTKKQYYNTTMIMRQALDYAVDLKIIDINPFRSVKVDAKKAFRKVKKKKSNTQVYTKTEMEIFYEAAWEDFYSRRHYKHQLIPLAKMFMFQTGIRISEACVLRYEDIEGDELHIQRMYIDYNGTVVDRTKSDCGDRMIPLTDCAKELIEEARARQQEEGVNDSGYIFSMTDAPVPYTELRKSFYKACNELGFNQKSSHKARKTFISTLIDAGVNINTIREIVGHEDERTTFNNYCFDRSENKERHELINNALTV